MTVPNRINGSASMWPAFPPVFAFARPTSTPVSYVPGPERNGKLRDHCKRTLDLRKKESISIDPVRIRGVEGHGFVEHNMGYWSHAHGGSRVPGVGPAGRIDLSTQRRVSRILQPKAKCAQGRPIADTRSLRKKCVDGGVCTARVRMVLIANSSSFP